MAYNMISQSITRYKLALIFSASLGSSYAIAASSHAGGGGSNGAASHSASSNGGAANAQNAEKGLTNAYAHSNNPVVNVEACLHSANCSMTMTSTGATYTSLGDIAQAAEQAGLSLKDFISTQLTITY